MSSSSTSRDSTTNARAFPSSWKGRFFFFRFSNDKDVEEEEQDKSSNAMDDASSSFLCAQNPPDVTHSNSSETSTTYHDNDNCFFSSSGITTNDDFITTTDTNSFVKVRVPKVPTTPEGLRSRPSVDALRRELQLEDKNNNDEPEQRSLRPNRDFLVEKKTTNDEDRMLPPAPSRSWSVPSQAAGPSFHNVYNNLLSPPISTNGFYLPEIMGGHAVAESPRLYPGQARTAVGAYVAFCDKSEASSHASSSSSRVVDPFVAKDSSSSPISSHHGGYDADADRSRQSSVYNKVHRFDRNAVTVIEEEWDEKKEDQPDVSYAMDNDPISLSRTPPPRAHPKRNNPLSPFSANISLDASPSSLAKPQAHQNKVSSALRDTSFSSGAPLLAHDTTDNQNYDFGQLADYNPKEIHVKFHSDQTHVSGMTQSILEAEGATRDEVQNGSFDNASEEVTESVWGDDSSLRHQKIQNQRRVREDLILAIIERLQDDVQLIADVYKADPAALQTNWFVKTPLDEEGLVTGFSPVKRLTIIQILTAMLDEMNVAQPEDFFLSPSQIQQYVQPHDELQNAIAFCRTIVQMAIPLETGNGNLPLNQEDGRWKLVPGMRPAMGIISSGSPQARPRGGDTSVFTLPSESSAETPMTSNVSFSTTIATSRQTTSRQPNLQVNGLQVRHTIETVSTLVQKLSLCCHALLKMKGIQAQKSVRITKDIKRYYLQLMAVDHCMLRSLADSFELEISPPSLSQLVSNDDEEDNDDSRRANSSAQPLVFPPPPLIRSNGPKTSARGCAQTPGSGTLASHDLFSPQTMDMMSTGDRRQIPMTVPEEYDDLRRQHGSVDYDDEIEETREGPETIGHRE